MRDMHIQIYHHLRLSNIRKVPDGATQISDGDRSCLISQYEALVGEYLQHLAGMQNVITINVAMSMGIIAAMTTIIAAIKSMQWHTLLVALPFMGLVTSIACIRTIHCGIDDTQRVKACLLQMEEMLGLVKIHDSQIYRPLHITLAAFYLNTAIFGAAFALSLAKSNSIMGLILAHKEIAIGILLALFFTTAVVFIFRVVCKNPPEKGRE